MNNPKDDFILKLSIGIIVISLIGLIFLVLSLVYLKNDGFFQTANNEKEIVVAYNINSKQPSSPANGSSASNALEKVNVEVLDGDWFRGKKDAPITIVEFSDLQCPFCARFHPTMKQVIANYPNDVRWVYKHFPLDSIHPYARKAAEATECAGEQNKFWDYVDELFINQSKIKPDYFSVLANELNMDILKFDNCISSGKFSAKVDYDYQQGKMLGVKGTPGNFVNGQPLDGAQPYETVKAMIESLK